ncbi:hypothetical protein [Paenibacillus sp. 481]|uniref:hypothetical protein n=1 Tax=Paenibacillus sp. 481 TaxID=2835869 RepID=UPI001E643D38|nr:hypothetical protein [Paenibacillus sp. 481]UHA73826.1 hypothetical protein KIK04_01245 [Paenibacillus sp. 481]
MMFQIAAFLGIDLSAALAIVRQILESGLIPPELAPLQPVLQLLILVLGLLDQAAAL